MCHVWCVLLHIIYDYSSGSDIDGLSTVHYASRARFKSTECPCNLVWCNTHGWKTSSNEMTRSFSEEEKHGESEQRDDKLCRNNCTTIGRVRSRKFREHCAPVSEDKRLILRFGLFFPFSCFHLLLVWGVWEHLMLWTVYDIKIKLVYLSMIGVICRFCFGPQALFNIMNGWLQAVDSCLWVRGFQADEFWTLLYDGLLAERILLTHCMKGLAFKGFNH